PKANYRRTRPNFHAPGACHDGCPLSHYQPAVSGGPAPNAIASRCQPFIARNCTHRIGEAVVSNNRGDSTKSISPLVDKSIVYACEIKETANGCGRRARGQTREAQGVLAQRRFARDV